MNEEIKKRIAAINSGIIPAGYKKTKVGIVPVEWDIKALGKISQFLDNQRKPVKENERSFGIYPYYGASGIIDYVDDYLFDGEYVLLGEDGANIVMRSSPLAFKAKGKMWINNHAHVISPNDNCNIDYLVNILESLNYEKYNSGTAQPKLNREVCESITIPFPPLPEQQKIAEILSTQDKLIELQERKINQLKTLKKGYLQKMFPKKGSKFPELRFKGFTDAWEQREFKSVFTMLQNNTLSRAELVADNGAAMNVHYGDILVKFGEVLDLEIEELPYIESEQVVSKFKSSHLQNGDVIVADTAEDETVGKCTEIANLSDVAVISGLHTIPLRPQQKFVSGYLGYYLNSNSYHDTLIPLMQGTKVTSISKSALQGTSICYPTSYEEQQKIGTYFRNLDNLITLHQRKLDEEKQKKKALMQLLLTGKVRVKL